MLDIKFIKENADLIKEAARKKHIKFDVDGLLQIDETRLETLSLVENLRAEQNKISDKVAGIKDATEREALIKEMRVLKERLKQKEDELKEILKKWQKLMLEVPNVPDMSVPDGASEDDNAELKTWGKKPEFSF